MSSKVKFNVLSVALIFALAVPAGFAQVRTTGDIQGTVWDPSSAVVPGATLLLKDMATGIEKTALSDSNGAYRFLSLLAGKYELAVTMPGFQKAVISEIVVETGRTTNLDLHLNLGAANQTVVVTSTPPELQVTSEEVSTTVNNQAILQLPINGRDTLPFALLMAGSQTIDTGRTSTFNGLPNASLNISLDGMNNNSQRFKSGGTSFFEFAPARLDAIEQVTVSTAGVGADASAEGAMQIRFVTRRGTDAYHGKLYEQLYNEDLNANTFFNNLRGFPRTRLRQNDFGGNFGGPLAPFVPYLKHRLFFFVNMEALPIPGSSINSQNVLTSQAQAGNFSYVGTDNQVHSVNVLQVARQAGFQGTIDPTVSRILSAINSTESQGSLIQSTDLLHQTLQWNQSTKTTTYYPTARLDYQINNTLAWHGAWNLRHQNIEGVPNYPGQSILGGAYKITTYTATNGLDWTIAPNTVNQFTFGVQSNGEYFYHGTDIHQWADFNNLRIHLQASGIGLTDLIPNETPFIRNNPVYSFTDNLSWVKGRHTVIFGGTLLHTTFWETSWNNAGVPDVNLDVSGGDPISSVFDSNSLPLVQSADVPTAAALYATLTGRISSISSGLNVDEHSHQYAPFAALTQRFAFTTGGLYIQDTFHMKPALTLNYGFRWELSGSIHNTNGIDAAPDIPNFWGPSTGPFQPGQLNGVQDPVLTLRSNLYSGDKVNPAPNFGLAWNPRPSGGWLKKLTGNNLVVRTSYGISYYDEGMNAISNVQSGNPGSSNVQFAEPGMPGFPAGGLTLASPLPPLASFPESFTFPMQESLFALSGTSFTTSMPNLHTPYTQSWTFGIQRELAKGFVLEARYVGNKSTHMWHYYDVQETNIFENGFQQEFKNAQNNLNINLAAGVNSFANRGLPGQVNLPVLQAAFGSLGSQGAVSAASGFSNGTFINNLKLGQAGTMATTLASTIDYYCRMVGSTFGPCGGYGFNAAGNYPINFFQPNPYASDLYLQADDANTNYNGLQIEVRKAYSKGLTVTANYTYSKSLGNIYNPNDQTAYAPIRTLRDRSLNYGPTPFDLRHVFQTYWTYALPVGKGRHFSLSNSVLNKILGDWTVSGIYKITSGRVFQLTSGRNTFNNLTDSGVVLNGITAGQLQDMFNSISNGPSRNLYWVGKQLVGPDGRANAQYLLPPTTPGELGSFVYLHGPTYLSMDMSLLKEISIKEHARFGLQAVAVNAFNHPVFGFGGVGTNINITSRTFGQTTNTMVGPRNLQMRAYISW